VDDGGAQAQPDGLQEPGNALKGAA
jgi:hypothetical protein